jgi:ElaB/YqjD/DUF883 family membrane-anchored ribosome-binding protein
MSEAMGNGQEIATNTSIFSTAGEGSGDAAHEYGRKIADAASHARDFVSEKATVLGDKIKDLQNKDLSEVVDDAKDYARKNPGQTILISAAAGLVLGLLLRGARR